MGFAPPIHLTVYDPGEGMMSLPHPGIVFYIHNTIKMTCRIEMELDIVVEVHEIKAEA